MLKKKYRLNLAIQLKSPELFKNSFFTLLVARNELKYSRLGFIASKKNDKRAVARNRVKRIFGLCLKKEKVKPGFDMIFIIKKEAFAKTSQEIQEKIHEVLKKGNFV